MADAAGELPVLVVGTGLIGASVGLALRRRGERVLLWDRDPETAGLAAARGAGTMIERWEGSSARLAVVAVPPSATARTVADLSRGASIGIVTHVASVQAQPQREIEALMGEPAHVVGGHPVAGRELSGPRGALPDLFVDRPWALCPARYTAAEAVTVVTALARACGAVPVVLDASEHDRLLAHLSHVPQLVASALAASLLPLGPQEAALAGSGIRDTTRLAGSPPELWGEIVASNAAAVAAALGAVAAPLAALAQRLAEPGVTPEEVAAAVRQLVDRGRAGRALLPGKHGGAAASLATVRVAVPDSPGALARLLSDVAEGEVNVEDLRVEHAPGQLRGEAELAVAPEHAPRLEQLLAARGWAVRGG